MSYGFVQYAQQDYPFPTNPATFSSPVIDIGAGHLVVVFLREGGSGNSFTNMRDGLGNTYRKTIAGGNILTNIGTSEVDEMWYSMTDFGGSTQILVDGSASPHTAFGTMIVFEYVGVDLTQIGQGWVKGHNTASDPVLTTVDFGSSGSTDTLVVSMWVDDGGAGIVGPATFTRRTGTFNLPFLVAGDQEGTAVGGQSVGILTSGAQQYIALGGVFVLEKKMTPGLPYWNFVVDRQGNALRGISVAVLQNGADVSTEPGSPLASIFSDENLTQPMANPILTDDSGRFFFYAATARYLLQIFATNATQAAILDEYFIPIDLTGPSLTTITGTPNQIDVADPSGFPVLSLDPVLQLPGTCEIIGGSLKLDGTTGSATIKVASAAGTPNPLQLPITSGTSGQFLQTDGGNPQQLSWVTPTIGDAVQQFTLHHPSTIAISNSSPTTIDTMNLTMPATGGPFRLHISYSGYMHFTGSGSGVSFWVSDGTNVLAPCSTGQSNAASGAATLVHYSGFSSVTYAAGASVTLTFLGLLAGSNTGSFEQSPLVGSGPNAEFQVAVVPSV